MTDADNKPGPAVVEGGLIDDDASAKLEFLLRACPELTASDIMSAAIRLWHAAAMDLGGEITRELEREAAAAPKN